MLPQHRPSSRHGFTLMELMIVIGIILLLAALSVPVISMVRKQAKEALCRNNLQQIGIGITAYQADNNNYFPKYIADLFNPGQALAGETTRILICPFDATKGSSALMGRANNNGSGSDGWGDLAALHEPGLSYFFETSNRPLGATEQGWGYPDGTTWGSRATTWGEAKAYQLKHGNIGERPFRAADFPIIRCFYHYPWKSTDINKAGNKKVLCLAWDMSLFWSIPYWEHQANPAIPLP